MDATMNGRTAGGSGFRSTSLPDGIGLTRDMDVLEANRAGAENCNQALPTTLLPPHRHCSGQAEERRTLSTASDHGGVHSMGNSNSLQDGRSSSRGVSPSVREASEGQHFRRSNLTALLDGQHTSSSIGAYLPPRVTSTPGTLQNPEFAPAPGRSILKRQPMVFEADSASGPVRETGMAGSASRLPTSRETSAPGILIPPQLRSPSSCPSSAYIARRSSWSEIPVQTMPPGNTAHRNETVRRCMSSKELGALGPPSGSPYAYMLYQREVLEVESQQRLMAARESVATSRSFTPSPAPVESSSSLDEPRRKTNHSKRLTNEARNRRRAEHSRAVIRDLCDIVTDLFVAESKLLNPLSYGVQSSVRRDQVFRSVQEFLSALPPRYALGVDTPSEVLLHMRLMSAARSNDTRAVVHIVNHESEKTTAPTHTRPQTVIRLVTIACADSRGLLEYITNMLSTGGSRVIDADVMLTSDNIVLDRFVVEMNGRLRLDKLANGIESFLKQAKVAETSETPSAEAPEADDSLSKAQTSGPLYFHPPSPDKKNSPREIQDEILDAVPLTEVLASNSSSNALVVPMRGRQPRLIRQQSLPNPPPSLLSRDQFETPSQETANASGAKGEQDTSTAEDVNRSMRERPPLVNREASDFRGMGLNDSYEIDNLPSLDGLERRVIPLIPFEELMLIETLGMGRVSTIYRAAWQKQYAGMNPTTGVKMVALKVASVNPETGDTAHVDELRREADIAAMLHHTNVCDLVGVAADSDCFCLAYEFCEGGSLLSLLLDTTRYYEYLPIALDIANGMAFLHHCQVIHRDLKPSNILLTMDHRAKISDFGMSVANTGQELTAETGTYRYMAPEVIRHESYSSNADVYSFGIVLWQLITREVPFATMTPIQAAWAVAEGRRPELPASIPQRLKEIICACWDQDSNKRPSFTYIAMALADYAKLAFSPANVGAQTLQIANDMLANVEGNSTVNVDFSVAGLFPRGSWFGSAGSYSSSTNVGLEI